MADNTPKSAYELAGEAAALLGIALGADELAALASDHDMGDAEVAALATAFSYLAGKRRQASIETLLRLSRLPRREPKTFGGFDFSRTRGRDARALAKLPALADLHARRNVAFIGPGGIGKTHLAQAYGRECCVRGPRTYYMKASEPGDRLSRAAERGNASRVAATLARPSCLVIDGVGGARSTRRARTSSSTWSTAGTRRRVPMPWFPPVTWHRAAGTSSSPETTRCSAPWTGSSTRPPSL